MGMPGKPHKGLQKYHRRNFQCRWIRSDSYCWEGWKGGSLL